MMQQRRIPRYRPVEYQPTRYQVRRLDKQALIRPDDLEEEELEEDAPSYVPLQDEMPRWDGAIPKKRATRTQALPHGRLPVDRPVKPVRPRSGGFGGWVFIGALFCLSVYLFLTGVVFPWLTRVQEHWTYGQDGVYHMQAYLNQGDSPSNPSDLYAYISHGFVVVDVVQDGRVKNYPLTFAGSSPTGYLVTLEVRDMGNGKPDILVHVGELVVVLWNNGSSFQGTRP